MQPPSGGCVLKRLDSLLPYTLPPAAAFGRLCVETPKKAEKILNIPKQPPSGGCVLKLKIF